MASPQGWYINLAPAIIQQIQAAATQCIVANSVRGISYSIAGRNFSFPSIADASQCLMECQYALDLASGARSMNVRANFNIALGRGSGGGCNYLNPQLNNQA